VIVKVDYESVNNPHFLLDADAAKSFVDSLANAIAEVITKDTLKLDTPIEDIYVNDNGDVVIVNTNPDGSTSETILEYDSSKEEIVMVIVDKEGNIYEVGIDEGEISVAREKTKYSEQGSKISVSEEDVNTFKNKIIFELIRDIKSKINIANYTGTNKQYLGESINNTDYILNNTNIVTYTNYSATGWYENGRIYASYTGNESEGDVKLTIFHEYLHHINYLYKLFPYRYSNENSREIYIKEDTCFYFGKKTLQGIYDDFIITLGYRLIEENWPNKYSDLEENQKQEVLTYKEQNKGKYDKEICAFGRYKPSNYYRDEISVYEICLALDGILFNISENKKSLYLDNKLEYEKAMQLSVKYENNNNINEKGYEK
jgi:hypothetical protein